MTWFKVDDLFWSHPKTLVASNEAVGLWVKAGSWASSHLTDGAIPTAALTFFAANVTLAQELVDAGLWEATETGYSFHDWTDYQPSRQGVQAKRKADAERVRRFRENKQNSVTKRVTDDVTQRVTNDVSNAVGTGDPTRPDPTRPDPPLKRGEGQAPFCENHPNGASGPCTACGDARRAFDLAAKRAAAKTAPKPPRARELTGYCDQPGHSEYPSTPSSPCDRCVEEALEANRTAA